MNSTSSKDYYQLLGISPSATTTELRSAYRKLALQHHPDRNPGDPGAEERFKQINAAYQVLSDPVERAAYDRRIAQPSAGRPRTPAPTTQATGQPRKAAPATAVFGLSLAGLTVVGLFMLLWLGSVVLSNSFVEDFLHPYRPDPPLATLASETPLPVRTQIPAFDPSRPALPQTRVPLAAGEGHACALTKTGGVKCWGRNDAGQLGDGTTTDSQNSVDVRGLPGNAVAVTAGFSHTCALLESGGVQCWGANQNGQLGNGKDVASVRPVSVVGLERGVVAITAGSGYTCALTSRGGVKCWGNNQYQQLGTASPNIHPSLVPVDVDGLNSGVVAIAAGDEHACALTGTGGVKCWGQYALGQPVSPGNSAAVTDVYGLSSGVVAIAVGWTHSCALTNAGGVKCWGEDYHNQLGDGKRQEPSSTPVDVKGLSAGVSAIAAGADQTCAFLKSGSLRCWGWNEYQPQSDPWEGATPVDLTIINEPVKTIVFGELENICVLTAKDEVKCWADITTTHADGTTTYVISPVGVVGLSTFIPTLEPSPTPTEIPSPDPVSSAPDLPLTKNPLAVGTAHACVLTNTGGVKCWGDNTRSQLGDGSTTDSLVPVDVHGLNAGVVAIAAGAEHTCALLESGGVKCWGDNGFGQLGDGTTTMRAEPVDVSGLAGGVAAISASAYYTCALTDHGAVKCWGGDLREALGSKNHDEAPVEIAGLDQGVVALAVGDSHVCVLTGAGSVECWGANDAKQLGRRVQPGASFPVGDVSTLTSGSGIVAIAAGWAHTCALTSIGGVKCWGANNAGQLGNGMVGTNWEKILSLGDVNGLGSVVKSIFAGGSSTCALMETGVLKCWGWIGHADGSLIDYVSPQVSAVPVEITTLKDGVKALALGKQDICVLTGSDHVQCWGQNDHGQLGNGTRVSSTIPVDVVGLGTANLAPHTTEIDITATPTPLPAETSTAP